MKAIFFIIILFLITLHSTGQLLSTQISAGYAFKTIEPVLSPVLNFEAHGFSLSPTMIIHIKRDQPANFGLKFSYQWHFLQAGYGRFFDLYSTDKYNSYLNGWSNLFFVSLHVKINSEVIPNDWFIEGDYDKQFLLSIGVKFPL